MEEARGVHAPAQALWRLPQLLHIHAQRKIVETADHGAVAVAQVEVELRVILKKGLAAGSAADLRERGEAPDLPRGLRKETVGGVVLLPLRAKSGPEEELTHG